MSIHWVPGSGDGPSARGGRIGGGDGGGGARSDACYYGAKAGDG